MKRGIVIVNGCYMCKHEAELCNHLLLWSPTVYSIWTMIYGRLGVSRVIMGLMREEISAWEGICIKKIY